MAPAGELRVDWIARAGAGGTRKMAASASALHLHLHLLPSPPAGVKPQQRRLRSVSPRLLLYHSESCSSSPSTMVQRRRVVVALPCNLCVCVCALCGVVHREDFGVPSSYSLKFVFFSLWTWRVLARILVARAIAHENLSVCESVRLT
jgi:hypothetical protein